MMVRRRFNGAATFRSRKGHCVPAGHVARVRLQWGRDLSVAEGSWLAAKARGRHTASMGPRPFGRGRARMPMPDRARSLMLQWGRDLSVAEGLNSARRRARPSRLQWGRDLSVAEGSGIARAVAAKRIASMGPRPFGRGRDTEWNGAAPNTLLQWGRDLSVAEGWGRALAGAESGSLQWGRDLSVAEGRQAQRRMSVCSRFNGAATFRSRKACSYLTTCHSWRGFNGAATFRSRKAGRLQGCYARPSRFNGAATFRSRKGVDRRAAPSVCRGFNGAATFRSRKGPRRLSKHGGRRHASMGPRPFGRGRRLLPA